MLDHKCCVLIVGLLLVGASTICSRQACGDDRTGQASSVLQEVLQQESSGAVLSRREALRELSSDQARWQAGMVRRDGHWVELDDLNQPTPHEREYELLRASMQDDLDSHRDLARWCQSHKLPLHARGHWQVVVQRAPDDLEARRRLGHRWIHGAWFSDEEIQAAEAASQQRLADLRSWTPTISKIVKDLNDRSVAAKQEAIQRLNQIQDPKCLSSLEVAALQCDGELAKLLIDAIAKYPGKPACLALMRVALQDARSPEGVHAIDKLKRYDLVFTVPELLNLLSTPIETRLQYGVNQRGELMLDRVLYRDTQQQREMVRLARLVRVNERGVNRQTRMEAPLRVNLASPVASEQSQTLADEFAAGSLAADDQVRFENAIAQANREQAALSNDVGYILRELTGQPHRDAEAWWKWWQEKNYRPEKPKPLALRQYQQIDRPQLVVNSYDVGRIPAGYPDCLVKGTLVQTATGLKPIESIRVGDLVVSQEVESGRLELQPVVQLVPRAAAPIVALEIEGKKFRSTQGHRWWVPGQGWKMAAELKSGMTLHTATGSMLISQVTEEPEQPTYNLVVDRFHTYFVGQERVLSFDNADPRPTLCLVPGYQGR